MRIIGDIACCVAFYTRVPVGRLANGGRSFADAQWAAPIAGAMIGLAAAFTWFLCRTAGLSAEVAAIVCLGAVLLLTGALHEDGAADTADGFGGGRDREHRLAIMRDSRIGTYGTIALTLSLLIRWSAIADFATPAAAAAGLVAAHAFSRALIPVFMRAVSPARSDGLSATAGSPTDRSSAFALFIGVVLSVLLGLASALLVWALAVIWFFALKRLAENRIGGQTGDVVGALQQGAEAIVLIVASTAFG